MKQKASQVSTEINQQKLIFERKHWDNFPSSLSCYHNRLSYVWRLCSACPRQKCL